MIPDSDSQTKTVTKSLPRSGVQNRMKRPYGTQVIGEKAGRRVPAVLTGVAVRLTGLLRIPPLPTNRLMEGGTR